MAVFNRSDRESAETAAEVAVRDASVTQPAAPVPAETRPIPDEIYQQIVEMVVALPEPSDDDSWSILTSLMTAQGMQDLNRPWDGTSGRNLAGKRLRITSVKRRPSRFTGGIEIFLIVESTDVATGERLTWFTSALAVVVQLAVAYARGWLPLIADVVTAPRPTEAGFLPYHLNVVGLRDGAS